jgi:hypothetical protein
MARTQIRRAREASGIAETPGPVWFVAAADTVRGCAVPPDSVPADAVSAERASTELVSAEGPPGDPTSPGLLWAERPRAERVPADPFSVAVAPLDPALGV